MSLSAKVYFVGAGPGDPELITVKGLRILQQADFILYADSLVQDQLIELGNPYATVVKSAGLALPEMVAVMVEQVRLGRSVARVHTGDPSVYGAILEQMALLHEAGVDYEVVPGVSSVFAAAAVLGTELTVPELTQTVILTRVEGRTPVPEREKLRELARHHCTLALYLSAVHPQTIVDELVAADWSLATPVAVVYKATWPEQKVIRTTLADLVDALDAAAISGHAMILAGAALDPELLAKGGRQSKLYDPTFSHRYRKGVTTGEAIVRGGGDQ